ncbi:MAG: sporulation protein YqfD [Oscillospiraceae bacterium]|nr:sporulation protein YqfD [Oscillospiraceae bacterium]
MLLIYIMRLIRGYVRFRAADGFPERFLNLCSQKGIRVWDVSFSGGALYGSTGIQDYKAMRDCAKRSGCLLRIQRKAGLPFFIHKYRRRVGLLIGLAVFVVGLALLSRMIWSIEILGSERVPEELILQVMEAQGLRLGVPRKRLDSRAMSEAALKQLPELTWISLNLSGSSAVVEVREKLATAAVDSETAPRDIVAAKAGQLELLEVYEGMRQAKPGDAVAPGALLAGGMVDNRDGGVRFERANAYAVARTQLELSVFAPRRQSLVRVGLRKKHYTLCVLWFEIPLGRRPVPAGGESLLISRAVWRPGSKAMPLAIERRGLLGFSSEEAAQMHDRRLLLTAAERFFDESYATLRGAAFLEQEIVVDLREDGCEIRLTGAALENIGKEQLIMNNEQ